MIKRIIPLLAIIVFVLTSFIPVSKISVDAATNAKTLAELRKELKDWEKKQKENTKKTNITKAEINSAKNSVSSKQNEIEENQHKVIAATNESEQLEKEIENGKESLEKLIKTYQIANGENIYLEYIFEATSYEELIYRYAVIEQVMEYQDDLINEWKDKIEYNNQLKIDLAKREETLNQQIDSLATEIDKLDDELEDYFDISLSIEDEIKSTKELIEYYEDLGCEENEDLAKCVNIVSDTGFKRPLVKGVVTSEYGYRTHPVTGVKNKFHYGIDIGQPAGTKLYSVANGMVAKIIRNSSCGGNMVYIHHIVKGKRYTTSYLHMKTINVKLGDIVTSNTIIGTVGGSKGGVDKCTTGAHLHFGVGTGWYGQDYISDSKWKSHNINPRNIISIPVKGKYWYSR